MEYEWGMKLMVLKTMDINQLNGDVFMRFSHWSWTWKGYLTNYGDIDIGILAEIEDLPFGNQAWLAGKSAVNGISSTDSDFFQQAKVDYQRVVGLPKDWVQQSW